MPIKLEDWTSDGDPENDWSPVFERLFASGKKGRIELEASDYVLSRSVAVPYAIEIRGEGGQWGKAAATRLICQGSDGLIIGAGASETVLGDFALLGPSSGPIGDGIVAQSRFRAERMFIQGFTRDGMHLESMLKGEVSTERVNWNLNNSRLENIGIRRSGRCGLFIAGVNASVINTIGLNFKECCYLTPATEKAASLFDSGFLGNKHTSAVVHTTVSSTKAVNPITGKESTVPLPAYWLDEDSSITELDGCYAEFNSAPSVIMGNNVVRGGTMHIDARSTGNVERPGSVLWKLINRKTGPDGHQIDAGYAIRTERGEELYLGRHNDVQMIVLPGEPVATDYPLGSWWIREDAVAAMPHMWRLVRVKDSTGKLVPKWVVASALGT